MPNFRQIANGFIHNAVSESELSTIFKELNLMRKETYTDYTLVSEGHVAVDTLQRVYRLAGPDFPAFLEANYDRGRGMLALLVKDIVLYLNGKLGHQTIITHLRMEERKLASRLRAGPAVYQSLKTVPNATPLLGDGETLGNNDLYRLMAGISPANVGRLLMLIGGENYYG